MGGGADAQVDPGEFELIEIGVVDLSGDGGTLDEISEAFGVNARAEVVGGISATDDSTEHAFLWLLEANYGLGPGLHDLHVLSGLEEGTSSRAHEMNDNGLIVGVHDGHAWLWHPQDDGTVLSIPILEATTPCVPIELPLAAAFVEGEAWSINNFRGIDPEEPDPIIVGWFDNPAELCSGAPVRRGFRVTYDPVEHTFCDFTVLLPRDDRDENRSEAYDINAEGCDSTPRDCTDVDRDGDTDQDDLTAIILAWGDCPGAGSGEGDGDPCDVLMQLLDDTYPPESPVRIEILEAVAELCE